MIRRSFQLHFVLGHWLIYGSWVKKFSKIGCFFLKPVINSMDEPTPYPMPLNCAPPYPAKFRLPHQKLKEEKLPRSESVYHYMVKEHTVDLDHNSWIKTVRQRLNELRPDFEPSRPCTIFKFPQELCSDGDSGEEYGPLVVSIGPYHNSHGPSGTLKAMDDHKWHCARHLLSRHGNRARSSQLLVKCLMVLKALDGEVRSCYSENLYHLDPPKLASIMFRDGCFIIHLLLKQVENRLAVDVEEEKGKAKVEEVESEMARGNEKVGGQMSGMLWGSLVVFDLLKLENQIPFFVIRTVFDIIKTPDDEGLDPVNLALRLFHDIHPNKSKAFTGMPVAEIHHLLHLFLSSLIPCNRKPPTPLISEWLPAASDLKRRGLRFVKKGTAECFLDVSYKDGRIEIPPLQVYGCSKSLFRNLIFFEQSFSGVEKYLTNYAKFMECIIRSKEDANLLSSEGIVENWLGTDEAAVDLLKRHNDLIRCTYKENYLANVFTEVQKYQESKWRIWRAQPIHDCFSNPWAGFAIIITMLMFWLVVGGSFLAVW